MTFGRLAHYDWPSVDWPSVDWPSVEWPSVKWLSVEWVVTFMVEGVYWLSNMLLLQCVVLYDKF